MSPKGPIGYFLIDSLDTLWIAGLKEEYAKARNWIETELDFSKLDDKYHTFEITIRVLGGLLSAFHLSGEQDSMLLQKAVDLADRLLPAFETVSRPSQPLLQKGLADVPLRTMRAEKRSTFEFRQFGEEDRIARFRQLRAGQCRRSRVSLLLFSTFVSALTSLATYHNG